MIKMTKLTVTAPDGKIYNTRGQVLNDKIFIYDKKAIIDIGYVISYTLPNGLQKTCEVEEPGYYGNVSLGNDMPIYQCLVKDSKQKKENSMSAFSIGTLNNYGNNQIGNNNTQNVEAVFTQILEKINNSNASEQEKSDARGKLKAFLKHPLVTAIFGASINAILGKIG